MYAPNCLFTAHVTFGLEFPTFRFQCLIEFRTAFIPIDDKSLPLYIECFLKANFRGENPLVDSIVFSGVMINWFIWYFLLFVLLGDLKANSQDLRQFLTTGRPLEMIKNKNVLYFNSKALFVLKIFKLFSWLFAHVEKRLISKFIISWPWKQAATIHVLPINSRSKGNHTMKFGQLIE